MLVNVPTMKAKVTASGVKIYKTAHHHQETWPSLLLGVVKHFCLITGLHGYKFIVLPKRMLLERVIWAIICLSSLVCVVIILCSAWKNFKQHPVISMTESTSYPIWNYEFPAVTVCNHNKVSRKKALDVAKNFTVTNGKTTEELIRDFRHFLVLLINDDWELPGDSYKDLDALLKDNGFNTGDVLKAVAPSCDDMIVSCKWKGEEKRCDAIFEVVRTAEGFCCSFNYFALRKHSFKKIFGKKMQKQPRRVTSCGYLTGLEILLDNDFNDYLATSIPAIGYNILIHHPRHFPNINIQNTMVNMRTVNHISVDPKLMHSTTSLKYIPVKLRRCLFSYERFLATYERYSYHNCFVECKRNMTLKFCGCVPYKYAHLKGDGQMVCSFEDIPCLIRHRPVIEASVPGPGITRPTSFSSHDYGWEESECGCLPDCEVTQYVSEKSIGRLNRKYSTSDVILYGGLHIQNQSVVRVYFKDLVAKKMKWDVVFTWHTLLAFCGGLLGLFVGFSFVSLLEVAYFFSVRLLIVSTRGEEAETQLKKKPSKVVPLYQSFNPGKVNIPNNAELHKYKLNSHFLNY
ncbi:hypothetical protein NQ315_015807 [Exocentrus adspersus]|uniref:Sodium channel protein Nach n=1 Tax=Exocentrus adspersus TaxID=1586481 RepID=A0AAV8W4X8_9CUCU|nr:hypothetical protein NQ315_015807 [Exocentrus adspersus]